MNIVLMGAMMALMLLLFHGSGHHGRVPAPDPPIQQSDGAPSQSGRPAIPQNPGAPEKVINPHKDDKTEAVPAPPSGGEP
jgi:hypothetical protein